MIKGGIDTNVPDETGFAWLREYIKRAREDSLNIKEEEYNAVLEIIDRLEKELNEYKFSDKCWNKIKSKLSAKQLLHILEDMNK